jgi:hypothetical protein
LTLAQSIVCDGVCSDERGDRLRAAQAERVRITYSFIFLEHGLFSIANMAICGPSSRVYRIDVRTIGSRGKDHKRKEFSPEMRKT